jgi:hypothetical protein
LTVSAQTTVNSSTGNGVTTVFPYAFKILRDADIEVLVDGVVKTLATHYTVSGVGVDSGGDVTLLSAPANGAIVVRRRNMQFLRAADYQYQGDLPNTVLNPDLDAPVMMAQQLQEQVSRSLRGPAGEAWPELPAAADRLDLFPVFDATTGALELSTVTQTQVASAVAAAYAAGSTADAVTFLQEGTGAVSRSVQAKLRDVVSLTDFGATGDGVTDDAAAIMLAHDSLPSTGGMIVAPRGIYRHASVLTFTKRIKLVGEGTHFINGSASATEFLKDFNGEGVVLSGAGSTIEGCGFRGAGGNTGDGIVIKAGRVSLVDVMVAAMGQDGIRVGTDSGGENCNLWFMERVKAKNNGRDGIRLSEGAGTPIDASAGTMVHTDIQSNAFTGLNVQSSRLSTFIGVTSQTNGEYGVRLGAQAHNNAFFGGDWEGSLNKDLRLDSGALNNTIHNVTLLYSQVSNSSGNGTNRIEMIDRNLLLCGFEFPATQVASTNANTLDDYEERDFSDEVEIIGLTGAGAADWVTRIATYTKVGNIVHVNMVLSWDDHTGTGNMRITGLPFTASATLGRAFIPVVSDGFAFGAGACAAFLQSNTTYMDLFLMATGAAVSAIAMDTAATLYLNFSYRV